MKTIKVKLLLVVFFILVLTFSGWYIFEKIKYNLEIPLYQISSCLHLYIQEHQKFPTDQEDLVSKGYLRIEKSKNNTKYQVKCDLVEVITRESTNKTVPTTWTETPFQKFDIQYSVQIDELLIKEGVLYNINADQKSFLLSGPHRFLLSRAYQEISLSLYEEMENAISKK